MEGEREVMGRRWVVVGCFLLVEGSRREGLEKSTAPASHTDPELSAMSVGLPVPVLGE